MTGCTVRCLFVTIETTHLFITRNSLQASKNWCLGARRWHFGRKKLETLVLKTRTNAGLYARGCFGRQCHRIFLVHDELDNWIVKGAAHGGPGQAGAIEQQVNTGWNIHEVDINFGYMFQIRQPVPSLVPSSPTQSPSQWTFQSRKYKRRVWKLFVINEMCTNCSFILVFRNYGPTS